MQAMKRGTETRNVEEESTSKKARYEKTSGSASTASTRGQDYEVALLCLVFLRALRHASDFFLASNCKFAGKFDDVVLLYRLKGDQGLGYRAILLQAKHKSKATEGELSPIFPFRLEDYLESFKKIRSLREKPILVGNREICLQEIRFVLYTNARCAIGGAAVDITENPEVRHLRDFLNTGGRLLQIPEAQRVNLPQGEETCQFLQDLILCTGQVCVGDVDSPLEQELCEILNLSSESAGNLNSELKRAMKEWWSQEEGERGRYLTADCEEWCKVLELAVRRLNEDTLNIDRSLNLDFTEVALQRFSVDSGPVSLNWICVRDKYQAKVARSRLLTAKRHSLVIDAEHLIMVSNEITVLWGNNTCRTLVVDMSAGSPEEGSQLLERLQEEARSDARRRLVVIARVKPPSRDWTEVVAEATWSVLHQDTQQRLLETPVRLQGEAVLMRDILGSDVADVMTDQVINWLCDCGTEITLGAPMPATLAYYVPRCLQRSSDKTITPDSLINTRTLLFPHRYISSYNKFTSRFDTLYRFEFDTIKEVKDTKIVEGIYNDYDIRQLCIRFRVKGISGTTSMAGIKGNVKEFLLFTYNCEEKIVVIEGSPGVGKSSFVTKMCSRVKQQFPEAWVLRLDMGRLTDYIKDTDFTEDHNIKEFLLRSLPKDADNLERRILEHSLTVKGNVFLFLDAFDEVSPDFTRKCSDLLKAIAQTFRFRQMVVTSRPVTTRDVEEALQTKAFILPVFCREEQNLFFKHFSEAKGKEVSDEEISFLHESAGTILEIPLLCRMAAEVLLHSPGQRLLQFVNPWRRILLYELFVDLSVKQRVAEKHELDTSNPGLKMLLESHKNSHLQNLQGLAVRKLMTLERIPLHLVPTVTPEEKLGLVVNTGDRVDFEHQTFAEYFLGCWLACHWQHCRRKFLRDVLLQDGFQFVLSTFSWSLLAGLPLHEAVARGDVDAVRALASAGTRDRGGRSALHVAAMTQGDHREVLQFLLMTSRDDLYRKDKVLDTTAIVYADFCENWQVVNVLFENGDDKPYGVVGSTIMKVPSYLGLKTSTNIDDLKLFREEETTKAVLMYALEKDLAPLFRVIRSRRSNVFVNESLLHIAAENNSVEVMKVLLNTHNNLDAINKNLFTSLQEASRNGHVEAVALLVERGAHVNIQNKFGLTALMRAAQKGNLEFVKLLLEYGADVNMETESGHTALTLAAEKGHLEVVKMLLEYGADVNMKTGLGYTALTLAADEGDLEVVKKLLEYGADVNMETQFGYTALTRAAKKGHLEVVKMLLEYGADVNMKTESGHTALTLAAEKGHLEVVKMLLEYGADVNMKTGLDYTALTLAAEKGDLEVVKKLLEYGADVNMKTGLGYTALTLAADEGDLEVVKKLLEYGADVNMETQFGYTALTRAAKKGHLEVVKMLLEYGADVNMKTESGHTALTLAAEKGDLEVVKKLLEYGADVNMKTGLGYTALTLAADEGHLEVVKKLLKYGEDVNMKTELGYTALTLAADEGHLEVVKLLLEYGADVNMKTGLGYTALTLAAEKGHLEVVKKLLEYGADVNMETQFGYTALTRAAKKGHLEVVKMLLEYGADVNMKTEFGYTALTLAAYEGDLEVVKLLLEYGADVNMKTGLGYTALTLAAEKGHLEVVKKLLEYGADVNMETQFGYTALTRAAKKGHLEVVKMLLEYGADVNMKTESGHTALTLAAEKGHLEVVKKLLEYGADVNMETQFGYTALTRAAKKGHLEVVKMLLEYGADVNMKTESGHTALTLAAEKGHLEVVKMLFENGADVNQKNVKGQSALNLAEQKNRTEVVSFLMGLS